MQTQTAEKLYKAFERLPQSEQKEFRKRLKTKAKLNDTDIVAYSLTGEAITRTQYIAQIDEAIKEGERGEFITQEDYLKERETWK